MPDLEAFKSSVAEALSGYGDALLGVLLSPLIVIAVVVTVAVVLMYKIIKIAAVRSTVAKSLIKTLVYARAVMTDWLSWSLVALVVSAFILHWIAGIAVIGVLVSLAFKLDTLAEENILFTKVPEPTAKAVMKGKSLLRWIGAPSGMHLNDPSKPWYDQGEPDWEVLPNDPLRPSLYYDSRSFLLREAGWHWVGIPPFRSVYTYSFEWNETKTGPDGSQVIWPRKADTDFIYLVDFPYTIVVSEAETKDLIPTRGEAQVVVRVANPNKAIFGGEDWMKRASGSVVRVGRNHIGSTVYRELASETDKKDEIDSTDDSVTSAEKRKRKEQHERDSFSIPVQNLTYRLPDEEEVVGEDLPRRLTVTNRDARRELGLWGHYGIIITTADLQRIDIDAPPAERKRILETTLKAYTADQEAYAERTAGAAQADVIRSTGTAEAEMKERMGQAEALSLKLRLETLLSAGEAGMLLAQLDAMEDSAKGAGNTIIWANNPFVREKLGLAETLAKLTPEQVKDFLSAVTTA